MALPRGCWTCRARHKKCDEGRPTCNICVKTHVPCHGYGPRPEWMDRGPKQEREVTRLTECARKGRAAAQVRKKSQVKSIPKTSMLVQDSSQRLIGTQPVDPAQSTATGDSFAALSANYQKAVVFPSGGARATLNWDAHSYEEAELILYYLDFVMPLQFPYCSDSHRHKARKWIFWLLTRNLSFRDAALRLSALHRYVTNADPVDSVSDLRALDTPTLNTLKHHYTRALEELQEWLMTESTPSDSHTDESLVELLATAVFLVSFEVFCSTENETAHAHFDTIIATIQTVGPAVSAFNTKDGNWLTDAVIFVTSMVLRFDITSSLSLGARPKTPYKALLHIPSIDMAGFMGCQNWVLEVMGNLSRIGVILETNNIDLNAEAKTEIASAHQKLDAGLKQLQSEQEITPRTAAVTRLFAYAALIELHAMTSGPLPYLPQIQRVVGKITGFLRPLPVWEPLSGLAWPLCVAGSMAQPSYQGKFEDFLNRAMQGNSRHFGSYATVLDVLKTCWAEHERDPKKAWGWKDALNSMDCSALLV